MRDWKAFVAGVFIGTGLFWFIVWAGTAHSAGLGGGYCAPHPTFPDDAVFIELKTVTPGAVICLTPSCSSPKAPPFPPQLITGPDGTQYAVLTKSEIVSTMNFKAVQKTERQVYCK